MKNLLVVLYLGSGITLVSCNKDDCNCTAISTHGHEMYTTVGKDLCEDQIDTANGETCSCDCK